jgi:hypothetical protein
MEMGVDALGRGMKRPTVQQIIPSHDLLGRIKIAVYDALFFACKEATFNL